MYNNLLLVIHHLEISRWKMKKSMCVSAILQNMGDDLARINRKRRKNITVNRHRYKLIYFYLGLCLLFDL